MILRASPRRVYTTNTTWSPTNPDHLMVLLSVLRTPVDPFDSQRIRKDLDSVHKIDAVLEEIGFALRLIPFEHYPRMYGLPVSRSSPFYSVT
jgi:hypothetical protein